MNINENFNVSVDDNFDVNDPKFIYKKIDEDAIAKAIEKFPWMKDSFILDARDSSYE